MLLRCNACCTTKDQKWIGRLAWNMSALAMLRMCWCFFLVMPFCWGDSTQVSWWTMPFESQNDLNRKSWPLSDLIVLIFKANWVSTRFTKLARWILVFVLVFISFIQVNLDLSSTIAKKHLWPCMEGVSYGPQMSTWMRSNTHSDTKELKGKGNFLCLEKWRVTYFRKFWIYNGMCL